MGLWRVNSWQLRRGRLAANTFCTGPPSQPAQAPTKLRLLRGEGGARARRRVGQYGGSGVGGSRSSFASMQSCSLLRSSPGAGGASLLPRTPLLKSCARMGVAGWRWPPQVVGLEPPLVAIWLAKACRAIFASAAWLCQFHERRRRFAGWRWPVVICSYGPTKQPRALSPGPKAPRREHHADVTVSPEKLQLCLRQLGRVGIVRFDGCCQPSFVGNRSNFFSFASDFCLTDLTAAASRRCRVSNTSSAAPG